MNREMIALGKLYLDTTNPRHDPVASQSEAFAAVLGDAPDQILRLAEDIVDYGMSPIELAMVIPHTRGRFIVKEGNRRIAALKILGNPKLAEGVGLENEFRALADRAEDLPSTIECVVVTDEQADHWMAVRHLGVQNGRGLVRWDTESAARFRGQHQPKGDQAQRAVSFVDAVEAAYPGDEAIVGAMEVVRRKKLTTLGRLVSDPDFRKAFGVVLGEDGAIRFEFSAADLQRGLERLMSDLSGHLTVSALKNKEQRLDYLDRIRDETPDESARLPAPQDLKDTAGTGGKSKGKSGPRPRKPRLFAAVGLSSFSPRLQRILKEAQQLDLEKQPNAAGIMLRVIIDIATYEYYEATGRKKDLDKLASRVRGCANKIDPGGKDPVLQPIRKALDSDGLLSPTTMHAFVHNPHYNPTKHDLLALSENYGPFLNQLNDLMVSSAS